MRAPRFAAVLFVLASLASAAETATAKIELTVDHIPANATEVVVVFDAGAAPAPGYDDAAAAVPAVAPAADGAQPPAQGGQRRRRFGGNATAALPPPTRASVAANGNGTATLTANVPVGENYQARVLALTGGDPFPAVVAGGRVAALKLAANESIPLRVALKAPEVKLAAATPKSVAPGARYTLAGTLTDAAHALGAKNRMRVWLSAGAPPTANYAGTQTSTIDVTTSGDDVNFSFELTAPPQPTTLYFQFGELPSDFARADGKQAAFVVAPDLSAGAKPLELRVE